MGYHTSNAAYAYDMQPDSTAPAWASGSPAAAPERHERPQFGVVTGAGRESSQETSPAFRHCIKLFCALAALFVAVGLVRVAIAGVTAGVLNENAALVNTLEDAQDESADLEVMYSVYGSSTRIRDLAESYGMVESEETVTLDFTEYASSTDADAAAADAAATGSSTSTDAAAQQ